MRPFSWGLLALGILLPLVFIQVNCDVIVERADNRKPYRIFEDQPARFGNALPADGLVGLVVPAHPEDGCSPITPSPNVTLPKNIYFISLIRRSSVSDKVQCTFQEKVENAQKSGYDGAIVYNYLDDELIPMGGDADVLIPSVFVGKTDGEKLLKAYSYPNQHFYVRITENPPFDINSYLLPFAVVVGICFLIMFGIMVFKCIQDRRRERRHRLPKSSLKKIPTKKFSVEDESRYETCCICLEDYVLGDKLRILPCGHAYHMKCIDPWLLKNKRVCPQCRKKVFATGEVPPSDSESETEDERAPLLARPRSTQGGTFSAQNENPFRRAARRLARTNILSGGESSSGSMTSRGILHSTSTDQPSGSESVRHDGGMVGRSSSPGAHSTDSSSTEGGSQVGASHNNQLITQVCIEQSARMSQSPTPPPQPADQSAPSHTSSASSRKSQDASPPRRGSGYSTPSSQGVGHVNAGADIDCVEYGSRNDAIVDVEGGEEDGAGGGVGDNVIVEIEEEDTDDATQQLQSEKGADEDPIV